MYVINKTVDLKTEVPGTRILPKTLQLLVSINVLFSTNLFRGCCLNQRLKVHPSLLTCVDVRLRIHPSTEAPELT